MHRAVLAVSLCACGGSPRPAPTPPVVEPEPAPPYEPYLSGCTMAPTARPDGNYELRGRPGEFTGQPCAVGGADEWLAWLAEPGHMLVSPPGAPFGTGWIQPDPIAVYDDGATTVVEVRSGTTDLRCTDDHLADGTDVHIDLPDQASPQWVPLDASDDPVRFEYLYTAGGCAVRRDGDATIIDLARPTTQAMPSMTAVAFGDDEEARFDLVDDVLLVTVPWRSDFGVCHGTDPGPDYVYVPSTDSPGFVAKQVVVPATASKIVVRTYDLGVPPPCA